MAKETTYAGMLGDLQRLVTSLQANSADISHLEVPRAKLENLLTRALEVAKQQAAFTAGKQESSRQLKTPCDAQGALRHPLGEAGRVRSAAVPRQGPEGEAGGAGTAPALAAAQ